jgi:WD40 repeat protein
MKTSTPTKEGSIVTGFFVRQRPDMLTFLHAILPLFGSLLLLQNVIGQDPPSQDKLTAISDGSLDVIRMIPLHGAIDSPVITAMDISPDQALLAAAGDDHSIRLVSIEERKEIAAFLGHEDWVRSVAFSESGKFLASCADDGWLRVWEVSSKKLMVEVRATHSLYDVSFLNEETLFSVGFSPNIYRLDLGGNKLQLEHACDCRDLRAIEISPTKMHVAYAGRDGVLRVREWDGQKTTAWSMATLHSERIRSLKFSSDGKTVTSVGDDRQVFHYDVATKTVIGQTEIRGGKLLGLCPLDDARLAVSGSDNTIRILGWNSAVPQLKLTGHDGSVSVLQKTDRYLFSAGFDTTIRIWDLQRAYRERDHEGRYSHPVAAQFEDSGLTMPGKLVRTPIQ